MCGSIRPLKINYLRMKSKYKKPILHLTDLDRDDKSVMIAKARSVAVENNLDWDRIYNQIKDTHERCIVLLELSKHFKIN
jgi:hypothetical protein